VPGVSGAGAAGRIEAGLVAFVAGDAFGQPWEGTPPAGIDRTAIAALPERNPVFDAGEPSDDTALTLLVVDHLVATGGADDADALVAAMAAAAPGIRGLGPSTSAALAEVRATGRWSPNTHATNGGAMRALPVGWATPASDPARGRDTAIRLTRPTHGGPTALVAACVMARAASVALDGADLAGIVAAAGHEVAPAAAAVGADPTGLAAIVDAAAGRWVPPAEGIPLDATVTAAAVLHALAAGAGDLWSTIAAAVGLGGDTDTVAALAAGVLGSGFPGPDAVLAALPPAAGRVRFPAAGRRAAAAAALAAIRVGDV
jgi:ADP-ribosylglycohydrolase